MSYREQAVSLRRWNIAAGLLHLASFFAALGVSIAYNERSYQTELTTDFNGVLRSLGLYRVVWVDLPFPLITAIFHFAVSAPANWRWHSELVLNKGRNPVRWSEYSITASLMVWVISQLAGITNVVTLVTQVLVNVCMQATGYIMERVNERRPRSLHDYSAMAVGYVLFVAQWVLILTYFFANISADGAPWFVYVIVLGLFVQFLLFGLVMTLHYYGPWKWFHSNYNYEWCYILLSFTTKLFLTWTLLIGIITR